MIRESYTAVVAQNEPWAGPFATEPYEAGWASEAVIFVRALEVQGSASASKVRVQISPDGIRWCDEGSEFELPTRPDQVTFARVTNFGGWLRIVGDRAGEGEIRVMVYIALKA